MTFNEEFERASEKAKRIVLEEQERLRQSEEHLRLSKENLAQFREEHRAELEQAGREAHRVVEQECERLRQEDQALAEAFRREQDQPQAARRNFGEYCGKCAWPEVCDRKGMCEQQQQGVEEPEPTAGGYVFCQRDAKVSHARPIPSELEEEEPFDPEDQEGWNALVRDRQALVAAVRAIRRILNHPAETWQEQCRVVGRAEMRAKVALVQVGEETE